MSKEAPIEVAISDVAFHVRNVRVRLPFRYGNACLLGSPILHCRLRIGGAGGREAEGVSADALPPRWFDKDPSKAYSQNVADLLTAIREAERHFRAIGAEAATPFGIWHESYKKTHASVAAAGLNPLIASFGVSILERALIDAVGKLAGAHFHGCLRGNIFGITPALIHEELEGRAVADAVGAAPRDRIAVRHTLGLADPIFETDLHAVDRINDGLPETLEGWVRQEGFRYYKIKVFGDMARDEQRLSRLVELLEHCAPEGYQLSLDGNENFREPEQLATWLRAVGETPSLKPLLKHLAYIEQPLDRAHALSESGAASFSGLAELPPIIIDESDDSLDSFKRAFALGYRGTSVKSCKGMFKGLLNRMLVDYYNETQDAGCVLTGEDLTTIPVVPLQQDLSLMRTLRLDHLERNGHHYYRGLDHVPASEREQCLAKHPSLYEAWDNSARLRMQDGMLNLESLSVPGLGVAVEMDWDGMTRLEDWRFESLGIEEPA